MRLDHLHIQNFRCYEDAHFDFQPGFNLVVGVNGSGKTSLLQAAALAFIDYGNTVDTSTTSFGVENIRLVMSKFEGRVRLDRSYPMSIHAKGKAVSLDEWRVVLKLEKDSDTSDDSLGLSTDDLVEDVDDGELIDLSILAFYRANRRWESAGISAEYAAQQKISRFDGYANWSNAVTDLKDFESWFIGKTLERMQNILEAAPNPANLDDELAWVNRAIQTALPEAHDLRYDLRAQTLLVDLGSDRTIPFNSLSDGQRGLIALIADIARRMCILNPHMGKDVLQDTSGVVIIDELDIHLHPAWQRTIVRALKTAFPKVQFIAASHSPQIIGSLRPGEIIVLDNGDSSHPRVSYGLDSSRVLEEIMGAPQREPEVEHLLSELFCALENNNLEEAKACLLNLKAEAPDLPEFARAEALLKRKEILGK
ncbi:AAA family ATPase [Pseudomonas gingeri]|uniref:AAA family ATPase n=1 Tax=Pseudomonas gingeri TaxID=117681 RepID=UPI0015A29BD3|nr:AAA family ATPase [Pseudomonas gingeri]NVZ61515.1 AAA family ATPase [Pseudomonas gingeri]NVZ79602.1 AAA family ATPase [Pseudomonas gingeri]